LIQALLKTPRNPRNRADFPAIYILDFLPSLKSYQRQIAPISPFRETPLSNTNNAIGVGVSTRENETRRGAVGEQATLVVREASFGRTDAAAGVQHKALGLDTSCFRRNGTDE
jgi:hypothetical protein